jgi:hypothetical protein
MAPATGGGPVGAGPGEAGKSSVHAGLGGTLAALAAITGGGGSSLVGGGIGDVVPAMATASFSAAAIAGAGLAKSVLGWVESMAEFMGEASGGESGIEAC